MSKAQASNFTPFGPEHFAGPGAAYSGAETELTPNEESGQSDESSSEDGMWSEPLPLIISAPSVSYPLDALPETIRRAINEVQGFVKAPIPMVASSALSALSIATQAHVNVERASRLTGPTSLFMLTIADSGERKSTCDDFFSSAIKKHDAEQAELRAPELQRYSAEYAAWNARRDGILASIKQGAKGDRDIDTLRRDLIEHEQQQPKPIRVPSYLRGDDTPENLLWVLSKEWPSAGLLTAEAGIVLGAHAMGGDSIMRNLSSLNVLWDGGEAKQGRRTKESFVVRSARFTMGLQVQEATLRSFFDRSKGLARGTGFLARFLVSCPVSTQGTRFFTEPPNHWPALSRFNSRLTGILDMPVRFDENGILAPSMLSMSREAKEAWVSFHDEIEKELSPARELNNVRDVASKTADNAARLAALFHFCEHGEGGVIDPDSLIGATRIAAWHLNESRRFFGELAMPQELTNVSRLNDWLVRYCREKQVMT